MFIFSFEEAIESVGSLVTKVPAWQCDDSSLCSMALLLSALPSEGSLTCACLGGPPPSSQTRGVLSVQTPKHLIQQLDCLW